MHLFNQDNLRDIVINSTKINQWIKIVNEYDESLTIITSPKKRSKHRLKENTRRNQSINKQKEKVYLNLPASSFQPYLPYESTKKKYQCLLNFWKIETGIKIKFYL